MDLKTRESGSGHKDKMEAPVQPVPSRRNIS